MMYRHRHQPADFLGVLLRWHAEILLDQVPVRTAEGHGVEADQEHDVVPIVGFIRHREEARRHTVEEVVPPAGPPWAAATESGAKASTATATITNCTISVTVTAHRPAHERVRQHDHPARDDARFEA